MPTFHTKRTVQKNHELILEELPFQQGDQVEVIIVKVPSTQTAAKYPLHGTPITYHSPTEPVAINDWEAINDSP